ncbi:8267_t:CDS:2 [Diversispora eburnea]|uniref:8267_t:CDS:1 n=1 Tax=Diversispora eburnea TaxID=1213867 RepID=A0A9N8VB80_9GLOM|nr:8267_t:CDS:2 [Diversispora eburnea]
MRPQPPDYNDITKDNLMPLQSKVTDALRRAYVNLCNVVKTHALVALGLTIYEDLSTVQNKSSESPEKQYKVDHTISPRSLQFLSDTGFDFNKQIRNGIPYIPGNDPVNLPQDLNTFTADLSEMFSAGIFDTKYVADYVSSENTSFLAYLFRKYEREQVDFKNSGDKNYLLLRIQEGNFDFTSLEPSKLILDPTPTSSKRPREDRYCDQYAQHGFCSKRMKCGFSHDLDLILDGQTKTSSKRKRKRGKAKKTPNKKSTKVHINERDTINNEIQEDSSNNQDNLNNSNNSNNQDNSNSDQNNHSEYATVALPPTLIPSTKPDQYDNYHSAHYDAYMTGFIFACQLLKYSNITVLNNYKNKLYLMGKNMPLLVQKSEFSNTSVAHRGKSK